MSYEKRKPPWFHFRQRFSKTLDCSVSKKIKISSTDASRLDTIAERIRGILFHENIIFLTDLIISGCFKEFPPFPSHPAAQPPHCPLHETDRTAHRFYATYLSKPTDYRKSIERNTDFLYNDCKRKYHRAKRERRWMPCASK